MIYIMLILFIFFWYRNVFSNSRSLKFIVSLYFFSFICGFVLDYIGFFTFESPWNIKNLLFIFITLTISFGALSKVDLVKFSLKKPSLLLSSIILKLLVFLSCISTVLYFSDFLNFIRSPDLGMARLEMQAGEIESRGIIYSFFAAISFSFHINLYLFFDAFLKGDKKISLIALFGSFSYIFWVSSVFGRDGFVFWVISFCFYFYLFKDQVSSKIKYYFSLTFSIIGVLFIVLFIQMSSSRFLGHSKYSNDYNINPVLLSTLDYTGQQLRNINTYYSMANIDHTYGQYSFSYYFKPFIDSNSLKNSQEKAQIDILKSGKPHFYFAFFLKEIWIDFGAFGALIFTTFIISILNFVFKTVYQFRSIFLLYIVYTQFLITGLFYNKFYFPSANAFLLFIFILIIVENFIYVRKK